MHVRRMGLTNPMRETYCQPHSAASFARLAKSSMFMRVIEIMRFDRSALFFYVSSVSAGQAVGLGAKRGGPSTRCARAQDTRLSRAACHERRRPILQPIPAPDDRPLSGDGRLRVRPRSHPAHQIGSSPVHPDRLGGSSRHLLIFSFSQSAICGITTGQYSTAQCSPRPSNHRSPSFAAW